MAGQAGQPGKKPPPPSRRAVVYIDGYNLYYNALKGTAFKWLDLARLAKCIRNNDDLQRVYFFTSKALGHRQQSNQQQYWRALRTTPLVEIVEGRHKEKDRTCLVRQCYFSGSRVFRSAEEKRTDVAIAVQMMDDAYQDACDILVLVSGDSDLVPAVRQVRKRFPSKEVVVYVPNATGDPGHHEIRGAADKEKDLPLNTLKHCQFAATISDSRGTIVKPTSW